VSPEQFYHYSANFSLFINAILILFNGHFYFNFPKKHFNMVVIFLLFLLSKIGIWREKTILLLIYYSFHFFVACWDVFVFLLQLFECVDTNSFFLAKISFLREWRWWVFLSCRIQFLLVLNSKRLICYLILKKQNISK